MADVNSQFLISLAYILIGYSLRHFKLVPPSTGDALSRIIYYVTLPGTVFKAIVVLELDVTMALMPWFPVLFSAIILPLGMILFRNEETTNGDKGFMLFTILGFNVGNFAYPLIQGIYGDEGLGFAAMFDFGNAFIIFCVSYAIAVCYSPKDGAQPRGRDVLRKVLTSPALISYIIGIIVNLLGLRPGLIVSGALEIISSANKFLVFLTLGIFLKFDLKRADIARILKVLGLRYVTGLVAGISCYLLLPFDALPRTILLVGFILPPGMVNLVYIVEHGYDEGVGGTLLNVANVTSFGIMWLLLSIF